MSERTRQIIFFLLVLAVTVGASISYFRGDPGWRRPPAPTRSP